MKCERSSTPRLNKWARGSTFTHFKRIQDGLPNHWNHTLTSQKADQLTSGKRSRLAQELDIVNQPNTFQNVICSQTYSVFKSTNFRLRSTYDLLIYQIQHGGHHLRRWDWSSSATQTWESRFCTRTWSGRMDQKPLLSNRERRTNIELLRQIPARNLSAAGIPTHTKKQSYEKWTVDHGPRREHCRTWGS